MKIRRLRHCCTMWSKTAAARPCCGKSDAAFVGATTLGARGDDQLVRAVAMQHHALLALQCVAAPAVGPCGGCRVGQVVARLALLVGQRQRQLALDEIVSRGVRDGHISIPGRFV